MPDFTNVECSVMDAIYNAALTKNYAELRELLGKYPRAYSNYSCSCGCNVQRTLGTILETGTFGKFTPEVYEIFIETGNFDGVNPHPKYTQDFYVDAENGSAKQIISHMLCSFSEKHQKNYDGFADESGELLTPQSEYDANVIGIIEVLFKHYPEIFLEQSCIYKYDPLSKSLRGKNCPDAMTDNVLRYVTDRNFNNPMRQAMYIRLVELGVPPSKMTIRSVNTGKKWVSKHHECRKYHRTSTMGWSHATEKRDVCKDPAECELDDLNYWEYEYIKKCYPMVYDIIQNGWVDVLKFLYTRDSEGITEDLKKVGKVAMIQFRSRMQDLKEDVCEKRPVEDPNSENGEDLIDPVTGRTVTEVISYRYDKYFSGMDEKGDEIEKFIEKVTV